MSEGYRSERPRTGQWARDVLDSWIAPEHETPPDVYTRRRPIVERHFDVTTCVDVPQAPLGGWSLVATMG